MIEFREYQTGQVITEPGAYLNVPMSVYHAQPTDGPSISSSGLRAIFTKSLKHYWDESSLNPDRQEFKDTKFTVLGRAAHHLLLGEADFNRYFVERPAELGGTKWNSNRTECRNWLAQRAVEGLTVLTADQMEQIRGMANSLAAEPIIQGGILNGYVEVSIFWKDEETGVWLKIRPDVVPNNSGDVSDLKCVSGISDDAISRSLGEHAYHQQGALAAEGIQKVLGLEVQHFSLVYVESDRPHCVRIDEPAPDEMDAGHDENHAALGLFARALKTGEWPGPKNRSGDGGWIWRPKWARSRAAERVEQIRQELAQ